MLNKDTNEKIERFLNAEMFNSLSISRQRKGGLKIARVRRPCTTSADLPQYTLDDGLTHEVQTDFFQKTLAIFQFFL